MSGHIKLIGGRFFDWIAAGKRVYTDTSWAIGFAPALAGRRDRAARHRRTTASCSPATSRGATTPASWPGCAPPPATASWPHLVFHGTFEALYGCRRSTSRPTR